jgi:hypothetical protein
MSAIIDQNLEQLRTEGQDMLAEVNAILAEAAIQGPLVEMVLHQQSQIYALARAVEPLLAIAEEKAQAGLQ